jgi:3-hydroxymyristoyl/3-hydroxydecanoyl-(acyl carrier protein) dehydratase
VTVPAHLRALCQARPDLAGVTEVICSAAPLAVDDALRFEDTFCIPVRDVLGSTETGGIATRRPARSALWDPLPGVSLQENEDKTLSLVSPFASGSDEAIPTGERGRVSQDGRFEYLGREDGIVKIGGKRLHLREVEDAVRGLSGVTSAFALTRTVSSMRGQELLLVVESERLRGADVKQALQERLDPTFVPRRIRVVGALPHNERGKITREAALALFDYSPESMSRPAFKEDAMDQSKKAVLTNQPEPPRETQAAATMRVLTNSGRFDGHFVELPVYPAVAQILDLLLPVLRKNFNVWSLAELKRVKWTNPIVPGDEVTVRIQRSDEDAHRFRFEIHRGDEKACVGTAIMMEEREDALSSEETPSR